MSRRDVEVVASEAPSDDDVLAIRRPLEDEAGREPWSARPSRQLTPGKLAGPLPRQIDVVLGNQIYIPKDVLTPPLRNRLIRLAAFQNPEFYSAQSMRMSTFGKPRIISCAEDYLEHIALPRGCMDDLVGLLDDNEIELSVDDQRQKGAQLNVEFAGELRPDQAKAAEAMLRHDIGVLSAATAFGKSVVGAYVIAQRGVNTLVVVHRRYPGGAPSPNTLAVFIASTNRRKTPSSTTMSTPTSPCSPACTPAAAPAIRRSATKSSNHLHHPPNSRSGSCEF